VKRDIAVIPKSVNQERIIQNLAAIEVNLDESDMEKLAIIGTAYRFIDGSFFTGAQSPYKLTDLWEKD
jgi:alcohol dehydrogenase (NADP+)